MEQLQEQAKKLDSSHKQKEKELITRFEQFDIEEELTKFEYLKGENFEEILSIIYSQEETIKIEKKELLKLERSFSKEKEKFIELSKLNDKFIQLKNNKLELEELSKKEDYYEDLRLEVEKLKELQKSKDKIIEYSTLLNKQSQLRKLEKDLLIDTDKYKLDLENNKKLQLELNAQKDNIEELRKETIDYKFFYNNFNELNSAKANIEIYTKTLEELALKKETYKELDSRLKVSKEGYLEDIEEKNILESSIGKLKLEILKKEQDVEKLEEYNNKFSEVNDKSLKLTLDKKQLEELEAEKKKLEQEVILLNKNKEQEVLNGFLLKLHEGDDCPLCRQKIEHLPEIPSLEVIDEGIEKSLQKVNKDIIQLETLIKKDEEEIGKISTLLKNLEDTINFKAKEELSQLEDELKTENLKLTDISKVIKISEAKIEEFNQEIDELSELLKNEDEIKQKHLEAKSKIEQFEKNVKIEIYEFADYYEKIQSQVEEFDNNSNSLQKNSNELLIRKTRLETEQKNNKTNLLEVSKRIDNIIESFSDSKLNKYYITLEMAEEDIAELVKLEEFESQISKFEDAKKIIVNTIEKLENELKEIDQPDLEKEQQKLQNIESQVNDFIEKVAVLNTRLENNKKLYKKIHSEYIELLESSKDIREIIAFSDVVSGKTENRKSLETYVQGYYLDLILVAGTKRLLQMTNDRYRFIRRDEKSKGGGLQGLEIEIHDIYLNSTRIISSLSGGELFLASLALALGLAEVIQNESGGISLETIFIDEGFGSLDAETLDIALTTLIDLQSYGRNIGIISHVSELKERIRPKVEVYSKDNYAKIKMTGI